MTKVDYTITKNEGAPETLDPGLSLENIVKELKRIADSLSAKEIKIYDVTSDEIRTATQTDMDRHVAIVQELGINHSGLAREIHDTLRKKGKLP